MQFKIEKNNNYTVMSNYHLKDRKLSLKAKGLLSVMLSFPPNWDYSINGLSKITIEGKKAIRTMIKELEDNKYLKRTRIQNELGRFNYEYSVYEIPYNLLGYTDKRYAEKDTQLNTNKLNTNYDKLDKQLHIITKELINKNFITINDLDIFRYDELFKDLSLEYEYKDIITATNYIIQKYNQNKGLDENGIIIQNKFVYFRKSITTNLKRITDYEPLYGE